MTNITKETLVKEIAEQLTYASSLEIESNGDIVYCLHIDEDGNIKDYHKAMSTSDEILTCRLGSSDDYEDINEIYEKEDLDDPDFRDICEDLAEQYMERYC